MSDVEARLERLERTVQSLLVRVERLPSDVLYREPRNGEWPVMSTLAHLSEMLPYWADEAARVAHSPGIAFGRTHDDPRRLGAIDEHGQAAVTEIVPRIRGGLDHCVRTLRGIPAEAWTLAGQHPRRGSMTIDEIVDDFLVEHAEDHAAQVEATLDAIQGTREVA